jgi:hypothetical protein
VASDVPHPIRMILWSNKAKGSEINARAAGRWSVVTLASLCILLVIACFNLRGSLLHISAGSDSARARRSGASGLTELPPEDTPGQNQITDSSFESGGKDWKLSECWSIDSSTGHEGSHSLRFDADPACMGNAEVQVPRDTKATRSYTLRVWVKSSEGSGLKVRLTLHDHNDRGFALEGTGWQQPGSTWQLIEKKDIDLLPVHDSHTLVVQAAVQGQKGTAWLDDVELIEQIRPPLSAFLLYPNFRGFLWNSGPQTIQIHAEVAQPDLSQLKLRARLKTEEGNVIKMIEQVPRASQNLDFDGSALGLGSYLLETELINGDTGQQVAAYPAYRISKVDDDFRDQLMNYIAPDNFLVRKGKKHFVWGVFDRFSARYRCHGECLFRREADYLDRIAGFDGMHTLENYADSKVNVEMNILPFAGVNITPQRDQLTPWLQALDRQAVGHLQIVNNWVEDNKNRPFWAKGILDKDLWRMLAAAMNGKPGGIGFYTFDEPKIEKLPSVFAQQKVLREGNPGSVTYGVLLNARQIFRWRDASDVIGCDPYPLGVVTAIDDYPFGATASPPMLRTSVWTRETVRQVYGSRPVWMVLQLYRMGEVFPTYEQMKMQAYKAIINGATGILWWGFVSERGIEAEYFRRGNPQSYSDFRRISREVMVLEPALLSPARSDLVASVSTPQIEYLSKTDENRVVIFASNFSEVPLGNVTVSLSPDASRLPASVEAYSEGRTLPLNFAGAARGASFTDSFGPYEVHVYRLTLKR